MTSDLEEMIRQRAHEIWEQEGHPHGRHEEHWQKAASEITQELDRIKASHTTATAEEIEAPAKRPRGRPRKTAIADDTQPQRKTRAGKSASGQEGGSDNSSDSREKAEGQARGRGRKPLGASAEKG